jgi:hypothetical protein
LNRDITGKSALLLLLLLLLQLLLLLLLLLLTVMPNTGKGGKREGGHGGTFPPVNHAAEKGEADREEERDSVEAEHTAQ